MKRVISRLHGHIGNLSFCKFATIKGYDLFEPWQAMSFNYNKNHYIVIEHTTTRHY